MPYSRSQDTVGDGRRTFVSFGGAAMKVYCFDGRGMRALSLAEDGSNLPAEFAPWLLRKGVELTGIDDDETTAISLIETHGYCCFSDEEPAE